MSGPNLDARMIDYAARRGTVTVTGPDGTRTGTLIAWRPKRHMARTYTARVELGGCIRTYPLNRYDIQPL